MKQSTGLYLAGGMFLLAGVIGLASGNTMFLAFFGLGVAFLGLGYRAAKAG